MVVLDAKLSDGSTDHYQPVQMSIMVKTVQFTSEVGTIAVRYDTMWLALMSSENRMAHLLVRTYPGGKAGFH